MKNLPIGTQYFPNLIENGCLYIDKVARDVIVHANKHHGSRHVRKHAPANK